jgi:hypothetical protein
MTVLLLLVFSAVVLGGWCATRVRRRRRRAHATMVITSFPAIELTQPYGGWDADAYDAGTGRGAPMTRSTWTTGPPSMWARQP